MRPALLVLATLALSGCASNSYSGLVKQSRAEHERALLSDRVAAEPRLRNGRAARTTAVTSDPPMSDVSAAAEGDDGERLQRHLGICRGC
jgi:Tfp pilus assembly protein PilE